MLALVFPSRLCRRARLQLTLIPCHQLQVSRYYFNPNPFRSRLITILGRKRSWSLSSLTSLSDEEVHTPPLSPRVVSEEPSVVSSTTITIRPAEVRTALANRTTKNKNKPRKKKKTRNSMKPEKGKDKEVPGPADTETPGAVEVFDPEVTCEWPKIRWDAKETCVCICRSMSRYLNFADPPPLFPACCVQRVSARFIVVDQDII